MKPKQFMKALSALQFDNVFNPYSDRCVVHDVSDAPAWRAKTLLDLLEAAAATQLDSLWIGRDLGYRGGRRTGLALTDDVHLDEHATRWQIDVQRPTKGSIVAERTAAVIWGVLAAVSAPVFLWNVFPLHPHEPGEPFTNRAHTSFERRVGEELLAELVTLLRPSRLIAIGNDAAASAARVAGDSEVIHVRHPSYGGQQDFLKQIRGAYSLPAIRQAEKAKQPALL
jgi:hypothetical protein